ncbi:MAG: hypothetical protein AB4080_18965 [Trichodesmium sp.]
MNISDLNHLQTVDTNIEGGSEVLVNAPQTFFSSTQFEDVFYYQDVKKVTQQAASISASETAYGGAYSSSGAGNSTDIDNFYGSFWY